MFQVGKSVQIGDFFSVCRSDGQAAFDFVYSCLGKIIHLGLRGKYHAAALFDVCILISIGIYFALLHSGGDYEFPFIFPILYG